MPWYATVKSGQTQNFVYNGQSKILFANQLYRVLKGEVTNTVHVYTLPPAKFIATLSCSKARDIFNKPYWSND